MVRLPKAVPLRKQISYVIPTGLEKDAEGKSWTAICGEATISIENATAPKGTSVVGKNQLTVSTMSTRINPGSYKLTIVQKNDKV